MLHVVSKYVKSSQVAHEAAIQSLFVWLSYVDTFRNEFVLCNEMQKEIRNIAKDVESGVTIELKGDSVRHMIGSLKGPADTAYEGGLFFVDIELDDQYPFVPPKMRFITKVWHPNISSASGAICLDILKDQWSPALTIKTALLSLQALLSTPEPNDPQDAVVARQYLSDQKEFEATARKWTEMHAHGNQLVSARSKVQRLVEMGFDAAKAQMALARAGGDENGAMELLLGT